MPGTTPPGPASVHPPQEGWEAIRGAGRRTTEIPALEGSGLLPPDGPGAVAGVAARQGAHPRHQPRRGAHLQRRRARSRRASRAGSLPSRRHHPVRERRGDVGQRAARGFARALRRRGPLRADGRARPLPPRRGARARGNFRVIASAADGAGLHFVDQRPADVAAPVVLWLQGLNAPGSAWAVQMAHFARSHRSIAPDARGVGKTDAPAGPYTTAQMADDAMRVLDACEVDRAHLVGLSLGGAVAQELALTRPDRVRTLALLASFARQPPRSRALLEAWRTLYPLATQGAAPREAWEKQAYAWLFSDAFWRSDANVRAAFRFASSQPLQSVEGFLGQVDAALAHDARDRLPL